MDSRVAVRWQAANPFSTLEFASWSQKKEYINQSLDPSIHHIDHLVVFSVMVLRCFAIRSSFSSWLCHCGESTLKLMGKVGTVLCYRAFPIRVLCFVTFSMLWLKSGYL